MNLPPHAELFLPAAMNEQSVFASVAAGWDESGIGVAVEVSGKQHPVNGTAADLRNSDSVSLWIDTRPSGQVHRATQFCHQFTCLPVDELNDDQPSVIVREIAQQRDQRVAPNTDLFLTRTVIADHGYRLEIWIPGSQLNGFREISELRSLGFYCVIHDTELGTQPLSLGDDFPVAYDPSTWLRLELSE
ncbi:MAG: hypothetical protein R3C19_01365 [Planctomycetaceae bacterium]